MICSTFGWRSCESRSTSSRRASATSIEAKGVRCRRRRTHTVLPFSSASYTPSDVDRLMQRRILRSLRSIRNKAVCSCSLLNSSMRADCVSFTGRVGSSAWNGSIERRSFRSKLCSHSSCNCAACASE